MTTKNTAKGPDFIDRFENTFRSGVNQVGKNAGLIGGLLIVVLIGFGAWAWYGHSQAEKESQAQSHYYDLEKRYLDVRRGFDEADQKSKIKAAAKDKKADEKPAAVATGDIAKDFGSLPGDFEALVTNSPNSIAASMAALNAAELYLRYGMKDKALAILSKVNTENRTSDLTSALVLQTRASVMADSGDCKGALGLWEKIAADKKTPYLRDESKLRMGLCYEDQKDLGKAEAIYKEVAAKEAKQNEREASRDAERYLHLLKMKQSARGG